MTGHGPPLGVGVFVGPWDSGHVAADGAVYGFADVERAVRSVAVAFPEQVRLHPLDIHDLLDPSLPRRLAGLDVVVGNCGPAAALLLWLRERHGLGFRLVREVRTTGWVGYAFQEWAAREWHRPGDRAVHVSPSSVALWRAFRGDRGDLFHYPILPVRPPDPVATAPRRAAFVGRLASEKGLGRLPDLVARLREAGWPLEEVSLVGDVLEPALLEEVRERIGGSGLRVEVTGPLPHAGVQAHLRHIDLLLFPSRSSVEGAGRAVVEALGAGAAVIGSDWLACHDLLPPAFRVPLRPGAGPVFSGRDPFAWVDLDAGAWDPPRLPARCALSDAVRGYVRDPAATLAVLRADPVPPVADVPLRMTIGWDAFRAVPREACAALWARLRRDQPSRATLVDLGGAVKQAILALGFDPEVGLEVRTGGDVTVTPR